MAARRIRTGRQKTMAAVDSDRNGKLSHLLPDGSEIKFTRDHGLLTVRDPRMFQRGREVFCRALAMAAARQNEVRSAQVDLGSSTFRLEFSPGEVSETDMAGRFAAAMRTALSDQDHSGPTDGKPDDWAALAAYPVGTSVSSWEIVREGPDSLKLRNVLLRHDSNLARRVAKEVRQLPGILAARVSPWHRNLKIRYENGQMSDLAVVNHVEAVMRRLLQPEPLQLIAEHEETPQVATGLKRVYYLVMASGSLTLTVVGFLVPGVPTVPFLMATSYYLVRSSPTLNEKLLKSRFFGPILHDLQSYGGLSSGNKVKLIGLTLFVGTLTVILTLPPLSLLLLISAISGASVYAISQLPERAGPDENSGKGVPAPAMA